MFISKKLGSPNFLTQIPAFQLFIHNILVPSLTFLYIQPDKNSFGSIFKPHLEADRSTPPSLGSRHPLWLQLFNWSVPSCRLAHSLFLPTAVSDPLKRKEKSPLCNESIILFKTLQLLYFYQVKVKILKRPSGDRLWCAPSRAAVPLPAWPGPLLISSPSFIRSIP